MAFTDKQIYDLNNMNVAAQNVSLGTVLSGLSNTGITEVSETVTYDQFTAANAVGTYTSTSVSIPVGATVLYSAVKAVTGFTGDTSATLQIGDGTTAARYSTGTPSVFTTAANGVSVGAPSGTVYHNAAKSVVLKVTSGSAYANVTAGSLTYSIYYLA